MAAQRTDLVVVFLQQISRPFTGKHHQIFCFTSIKLSCNSLRDKTYMCRTIYFNHRGFPNSLSPPHKADVKALRKSMSKFHPPGNLVASVWKDTKLVCFKASIQIQLATKQSTETIVQVLTVPATISYNKNMGGLDLNDKARNYYAVGCELCKW